jgi:hypothetical protein
MNHTDFKIIFDHYSCTTRKKMMALESVERNPIFDLLNKYYLIEMMIKT